MREIQFKLEQELCFQEAIRSQTFYAALDAALITRPNRSSTITPSPPANTVFRLDHELQRSISQLVAARRLSLPDVIRLVRNETASDTRPNKALKSTWIDVLLAHYPLRELMCRIVRYGVMHPFNALAGDGSSIPPPNHKSAAGAINALRRSVHEGQSKGTYLVVDSNIAETWDDLHYSPFGCVVKKNCDIQTEARVIHDLSFPTGLSTNAASSPHDIPPLTYCPIHTLASRIEEIFSMNPHASIKMKKGDVKSAFRNVPVNADIAKWFVGRVPEDNATVIDLSLPFGWTGSPAFYGVFGGAISYLLGHEAPSTLDPHSSDSERFFSFEWVDDHVLIEEDRERRLELCECALRLAMLATLGPRSINEAKFSTWESKTEVLGLEWDTIERTVSMPMDKIEKALQRVHDVLRTGRASRTQLDQLLGSLRHVCTCIRSAKPFYQRIVAMWRRAHTYRRMRLTPGAHLDLLWFEHTLQKGRLRSVPTSFFGNLPEPDVHLYMDASDFGLCVLHPARHEFLRVCFDHQELELIRACKESTDCGDPGFTINVREQLSAVLALLTWGPTWSSGFSRNLFHVQCWLDNRSAVSWCNSLASRNPYSQELNRVLGVVEAWGSLRLSAQHLAGKLNTLADLGSRAWGGDALVQWTNLTHDWQEVRVHPQMRKIYDGPWSNCNSDHWLIRPVEFTHPHGGSGWRFDSPKVSHHGYHATTPPHNRYNWLHSHFIAGSTMAGPHLYTTPFGPSSAILAGIIALDSESDPESPRDTNLSSRGFDARVRQVTREIPSHTNSSPNSQIFQTLQSHSTACSLGLRCWAFSSYFEDRSTFHSTAESTPTAFKFKM